MAKATSDEPEAAVPAAEVAEITDETPIMEDEVQTTKSSKSGLGVADSQQPAWQAQP